MYGIIVYGSWLSKRFASGEIDYSDWVRDAMLFDSKEKADNYVYNNLADMDQSAIAVVEVTLRASR